MTDRWGWKTMAGVRQVTVMLSNGGHGSATGESCGRISTIRHGHFKRDGNYGSLYDAKK